MSHLSCDCLLLAARANLCVSLMILLATTVVRDSQMKLTRARALRKCCCKCAVSVQRTLARIMAVVEDEAKMRRRHYAVDCHRVKTGQHKTEDSSSSDSAVFSLLSSAPTPYSHPTACLAMTIAMQLTTMAARATRAMQSAGRKCGPEAQPELEQQRQHEQELK